MLCLVVSYCDDKLYSSEKSPVTYQLINDSKQYVTSVCKNCSLQLWRKLFPNQYLCLPFYLYLFKSNFCFHLFCQFWSPAKKGNLERQPNGITFLFFFHKHAYICMCSRFLWVLRQLAPMQVFLQQLWTILSIDFRGKSLIGGKETKQFEKKKKKWKVIKCSISHVRRIAFLGIWVIFVFR